MSVMFLPRAELPLKLREPKGSGHMPVPLDALRRHGEAGQPLCVLTTIYADSTERRALDQVTGLEWNVRAPAARNPDVSAKFGAVFDSYWIVRPLNATRRSSGVAWVGGWVAWAKVSPSRISGTSA